MSFSIQTSDLGGHTIPPEPRQSGIVVEELVAKVADLYQGKVFERVTEGDSFDLSGVVPIRLRGKFGQNTFENDETQNQFGSFGVHEIFERCVNRGNDRVQLLIQGPAGSGKSTLIRQLTALWHKCKFSRDALRESEKKLCTGFDRYKLVVRIPLSELGGEYPILWEEYLFDQLDFDDRDWFSDTLKSLLKKREILFLLDDYSAAVDSIDFRATGIMDVLRTQHWMMTSRPDCYRRERGGKFELFEITGLSPENVQRYIRGYFSEPEKAESLIQLTIQFPNLDKMTRIPLLLEIICFNWRENQTRVFANATTTSLFQFLVLNILQKYLAKSLGKKVRYFTSLDLLLSDRESTHRNLETAISLFVDVMEQMAFLHLISDEEKYSFRREDPNLIDLVSAVIRKANLSGIPPADAPELLDILFDKMGLLKAVQNKRGVFLHTALQEYFAGRYLAKCVQTNREVLPGKSWQTWVDENKFDRRLDDIFRFAAGEMDLRQNVEGLNGLFSQILSDQRKSVFRTHEQVLSARCLDEVRNVMLPVKTEVVESLIDRFYLADPTAVLYLLESSLVVGNKRYEEALCYHYNKAIGPFIRAALRSSRSVPKRVAEYILDRLCEGLRLILNSNRLEEFHEKIVIRYIRDIGSLRIQNKTIARLLRTVLGNSLLGVEIRLEALRTIYAIQIEIPETDEVLFKILEHDLYFGLRVQAAILLVETEGMRARIIDLIRKKQLYKFKAILPYLIDLLEGMKPASQEVYLLLRELLLDDKEAIRLFAARILNAFYRKMYPEVEELLREYMESLELEEEECEEGVGEDIAITAELGDQLNMLPDDPALQEEVLIEYLRNGQDIQRNIALNWIEKNKLFSRNVVNALVDCLRSQPSAPATRQKLVKLLGKAQFSRPDVSEVLYQSLQDMSIYVRQTAIKGIMRQCAEEKEIIQAFLSNSNLNRYPDVEELLLEYMEGLERGEEEEEEGAGEGVKTDTGLEEEKLIKHLLGKDDWRRSKALDSIRKNTELSENLVNVLVGCLRSQPRDLRFREKLIKLLGEVQPPRATVSEALTESLKDISLSLEDNSLAILRRAIKGILKRYTAGKEVAQAILSIFQTDTDWKLISMLRNHLPKLGKVTALVLDSLKRGEIQLDTVLDFLRIYPTKDILGWYFSGKMESSHFIALFHEKLMKERPLIFLRGECLYLEENRVLKEFSLKGHEGLFENLFNSFRLLYLELGRIAVNNPSRTSEAVCAFRTALEMGTAQAHIMLAASYGNGKGVAKDTEKKMYHLRMAAEAGDVRAMTILGLSFDSGRDTKRDVIQAVKYYEMAADEEEKGWVQGNLAALYLFEDAVRDLDKAFDCFKKGAAKGYVGAVFGLGYCYEVGAGIPVDIQEADKNYDKSISFGLLQMWKMGELTCRYPEMIGVLERLQSQQRFRPSEQRGEEYYMQACELEFGENSDFEEALVFYRLAAGNGHEGAIERLEQMEEDDIDSPFGEQRGEEYYMRACELEFGEDPDLRKALEFYRLAAENEHEGAFERLIQLDEGNIVHPFNEQDEEGHYSEACALEFGDNPDLEEALHCYRLAAEKGHLGAKQRLERLEEDDGNEGHPQDQNHFRPNEQRGEKYYLQACEHEFGDNPDLGKALDFYRLAADNGYESAIERLKEKDEGGVKPPSDEHEVEEYYREACVLESRYNPDPERALKLYRLAAEKGHVDAKERLERLEEDDSNPPLRENAGEEYYMKACALEFETDSDLLKAFKFYHLAAEDGHRSAIERLKQNEENDRNPSATEQDIDGYYLSACKLECGSDPDPERAFQFYNLAAENGHVAAMERISDMAKAEIDLQLQSVFHMMAREARRSDKKDKGVEK